MSVLKIAIDDGSTNVKLCWFEGGELHSQISANSFRNNWKSSALRASNKVFNYQIGTKKYTYDATSERALATTHIDYQYDDLNLLGVHHALLQTGLPPQPVKIIVTLPITEYYDPDDCQRNDTNIERKRANLMREISLNKGELFDIVDVEVMPENLPAVLSTLVDSKVNALSRSLVIDLGGTTLDMSVIAGEFEDVSAVYGNKEIGVSIVTDAAKQALANADSDASYLVANELIRQRHDPEFVRAVVNDDTRIEQILAKLEDKISELGYQVAAEAKKLCKNPHRIFLVGGGASLVEQAIRDAYPSLSNSIQVINNPQMALAREICLYHAADTTVAETAETVEA